MTKLTRSQRVMAKKKLQREGGHEPESITDPKLFLRVLESTPRGPESSPFYTFAVSDVAKIADAELIERESNGEGKTTAVSEVHEDGTPGSCEEAERGNEVGDLLVNEYSPRDAGEVD